ncbi:efflux RND transporter periplasmic adaptor subunit [Paludisphaera borealis]|uniref:Cobalt-zinc-cadmium resistance protein CzcB n=1 Tax=Paludisphaera borealis TaxID=1387353 RepID=A0A1U7CXM1_9BACT|nr:efflux RND transporter periplasmic adaptor subunit [Paludisphaera borealis]APW63694.1 Cobalt-zinc-cadmium resistance protein CzcB [Paludisphaera borealis]
MPRVLWTSVTDRFAGRLVAIGILASVAFVASGCHGEKKAEVKSVTKPPVVKVVHPERRNIVRVVGQPSFIESFERTSIYPKLTGYIEKWNVDIGDKVKKGQVMATLFVPELVEDFETKKATVGLDGQKVDLALKIVDVAAADVQAAEARVVETKAILAKYTAEVERWNSEVKRLDDEVRRGVVDPQVLLESTNQWKSAAASREAARADIMKAEAELLSDKATLAKSKVAVEVARADLAVATSEAKRIEAWVGYITLPAPYDGVVVARNANTGDFVLPAAGDPTAMQRSPHLAPGGNAAPIYVVDKTDVVRIFIDIPEQDANYVKIGTKASVLARAYRDEPLQGSVTRTSWALNIKSRTLRAEIDLPNPGSQLLPGMYAYANVIIERPGVRALPLSALTHSGEKTYCWKHENGRAVRTEVQTGVSDGEWIEVTNRRVPDPKTLAAGAHAGEQWTSFDGSEQLILDEQSILTDGLVVEVEPATDGTKVTSPTPDAGHPTTAGRPDKLARVP